jgi:hypothetical protein
MYTDDTYTSVSIENASEWTYLDLTGEMESNKTIKNIRINGGTSGPIYVDDVTLTYTSVTFSTVTQGYTNRGATNITLIGRTGGTVGIHLSKAGFYFRKIGDSEWDSIITDIDDDAPSTWNIVVENLSAYKGYEYKATAYCDDELYPELIGWYNGTALEFQDSEEEATDSVLVRPYSIVIGPYDNATGSYEWFGVKSIKWNDVTPWVHIDIPQGPMLHQHLRSPHVDVTIEVMDIGKMHTALFNTMIDSNGHVAVDINNNNKKYPITYCIFKFMDINNDIVEYSVKFLRIATIGVDNIESGKETRFIIRATADLIKKES